MKHNLNELLFSPAFICELNITGAPSEPIDTLNAGLYL